MTRNEAERIEFSRPDDLPGVEVLLAEHSSRRWRWFHETYSVCSVVKGMGTTEWRYRGKLHEAVPGEVILYEPGEVHANRNVLVDATFRVLFLQPGTVESAAIELGIPHRPHWDLAQTSDPSLRSALRCLHYSLERSSASLETTSRFADCLRRLLEHCSERGTTKRCRPTRAALDRIREFLHENYSHQIKLEDLAGISGLSRFHVVRAFASEFGLPPHTYQIHVRVAKARKLLAVGRGVADLAAEIGFSDQSHFTRHFKRITHVTPGHYAFQIRNSSRKKFGEVFCD